MSSFHVFQVAAVSLPRYRSSILSLASHLSPISCLHMLINILHSTCFLVTSLTPNQYYGQRQEYHCPNGTIPHIVLIFSRKIETNDAISGTHKKEDGSKVAMYAAWDCRSFVSFEQAMVSDTDAELEETEQETNDADDLVRRLEIFGLRCIRKPCMSVGGVIS